MKFRASWLLPISQPPISDGWVRVEAGRIVAFGQRSGSDSPRSGEIDLGSVANYYTSPVPPAPDRVNQDSDNVISILDLEIGAGWQSECGRWRLTTGYMVSTWLNTIPQNQWIQAVQTNNFASLSNSVNPITFDGVTARLDYRW